MYKQIAKRPTIREELMEYSKLYNKEVNIDGVEALYDELCSQEHDLESGVQCLGILIDSYNYELDDAIKAMGNSLSEVRDRETLHVYLDALDLIVMARKKFNLSKDEVMLCVNYTRFITILPITEENVKWSDISNNGELRQGVVRAFQDLNSGRLFKEIFKDGRVRIIDIGAKVFSEDGGLTWFNEPSRYTEVKLPYVIKEAEHIFLDENGEPTKDKVVIKKMREKALHSLNLNEAIWEAIREHLTDVGLNGIKAIHINKDELDSATVGEFMDLVLSKLGGKNNG